MASIPADNHQLYLHNVLAFQLFHLHLFTLTLVHGRPLLSVSHILLLYIYIQERTHIIEFVSSGRKIGRNVMSMASSATTEAEAETGITAVEEVATSDLSDSAPELIKTIQQAVRNIKLEVIVYM